MTLTQPPVPEARPNTRTFHGDTITDRWDWLRDKTNPSAVPHLEAENQWTSQQLTHTQELQNTLVNEFREHTQLDDTSVPQRVRNWWYYRATDANHDYPRYYRIPADPADIYQTPPTLNPDNPAETTDGTRALLLLDVNALAEGHTFTDVDNVAISPDDSQR